MQEHVCCIIQLLYSYIIQLHPSYINQLHSSCIAIVDRHASNYEGKCKGKGSTISCRKSVNMLTESRQTVDTE